MSNKKYEFTYSTKVIKPKGKMVYEYNPLYNYRLNKEVYSKDKEGHYLSADRTVLEQAFLVNKECTYSTDSHGNPVFIIPEDQVQARAQLEAKFGTGWSDLINDEVQKRNSLDWSHGFGYDANRNIYPLVMEEDGIIQDLVTSDADGDGGKGGNVLDFDLRHPVEITCQQSYDGSTNLILNDNKHIPRLINTRFTPLEHNTYERVDRKGNTDTNLYDFSEFDLDTSLTKRYKSIPYIRFERLLYGGELKVGMYHIFIKLADADGNETDILAESGCIPVYVGAIDDPGAIRGGQSEENSFKSISLTVYNVDSAYDYVHVYFTRTTATAGTVASYTCYKIDQNYRVLNNKCDITITGQEFIQPFPFSDIAIPHATFKAARTQAICQNRLFLGNVTMQTVDHDNLQRLSLNFLPFYSKNYTESLVGEVDEEYNGNQGRVGYYNANNVYSYVGYWPEEMYRFGVVYIMKDGTLSPVYNIRGIGALPNIEDISISAADQIVSPYYKDQCNTNSKDLYQKKGLNNPYTNPSSSEFVVDYDTWLINSATLENAAGVVKFPSEQLMKIEDPAGGTQPDNINIPEQSKYIDKETGDFATYSLVIKVSDSTLQELKSKYGVRGYFIVRQKRIPTILAQALVQGFSPQAGIPLMTASAIYPEATAKMLLAKQGKKLDPNTKTKADDGTEGYGIDAFKTEMFIESDGDLAYDEPEFQIIPWYTDNNKELIPPPNNDQFTAFCPEFEQNQAYYNAIFTGAQFPVKPVTGRLNFLEAETGGGRHFHATVPYALTIPDNENWGSCKIITVPDGTPAIRIGDATFRGRCGNPEDIKYQSLCDKQFSQEHPPVRDNFATSVRKKKKRNWIKWLAVGVAAAVTVVASIYTCGAAAAAGALLISALLAAGATAAATAAAKVCQLDLGYYKHTDGINDQTAYIVRGLYGPYLGITNASNLTPGSIINIYVPGTELRSNLDQFKVRFNDSSPYFAITDRTEIGKPFESTTVANDSVFTVFRGDCYVSTCTHRINRNFSDPDAPTNDEIVSRQTWIENWNNDAKENSEVNRGDVNAVPLGTWVTFPCRTSMNLAYRDVDHGNPGEEAMFGHKRAFYPFSAIDVSGSNKIPESDQYNQGFSTSVSPNPYYTLANVPYIKNVFQTRIAYSLPSGNDAFRNGIREFSIVDSKDYPLQYGGITRLVEFFSNLLVIFEHGIGLAKINERALLKASTEEIKVGAASVLPESLQMLTTDFGTQWSESVCKTDSAVYGLDTVAKKIWQVTPEGFKILSDFQVETFLIDNIKLGERELDPIIGVRNVKTHYNANKHDVMFTYYDGTQGFEEVAWNLCYNEYLKSFTTFYSWIPSYSANIHNQFFSYDRNTSKWISKLGMSKSGELKEKDNQDGYSLYDSDAEGVCLNNTEMDTWDTIDNFDDNWV